MIQIDPALVKLLIPILETCTDEFSNHGCNDYPVPITPDNVRIQLEMCAENVHMTVGEFRESEDYEMTMESKLGELADLPDDIMYLQDHALLGFFKSKLEEALLEAARLEYSKPHDGTTVRDALDKKRQEREKDIKALVLCKRELFYLPATGHSPEDTVYPVSLEVAQEEANFFGVQVTEE